MEKAKGKTKEAAGALIGDEDKGLLGGVADTLSGRR